MECDKSPMLSPSLGTRGLALCACVPARGFHRERLAGYDGARIPKGKQDLGRVRSVISEGDEEGD